MRARINDWFRIVIAQGVQVAGIAFTWWERFGLQRKYKGDLHLRTDGKFAVTSGTTGDPKRILYTNRRLREFKSIFIDMFARACRVFRIKRTSLYVFSSFKTDESLTSLLLEEVDLPNYFITLQAPYRIQRHPAMSALAAEYGGAAVRLWILAISNPGVLYSTNPSTLSTFFDELNNHWHESSALIRNWRQDRKSFNANVRKIARRLDSIGSNHRLEAIASSDAPVPISTWAPALEAYICWTGGYVKPFLDRVQKYLPPSRYRLIPMYSMSTETVETLTHFENGEVYFLPIAPGVFYEFLDAESDQLLVAHELEPGKTYEMIVSDDYGLRRYHTNDLFLCRRKCNDLPDLVFVRRRTVAYSFTGEKLTGEQVSLVFDKLRGQFPHVFANNYLTCIPSHDSHTIPHYKLVLVGDCKVASSLDVLAARCDELLSEVNCEYRSKRTSGRLGPVTCLEIGTREFAERFSAHGSWESQFKFLPLCPYLMANRTERVS
jgi:hypothetical protein